MQPFRQQRCSLIQDYETRGIDLFLLQCILVRECKAARSQSCPRHSARIWCGKGVGMWIMEIILGFTSYNVSMHYWKSILNRCGCAYFSICCNFSVCRFWFMVMAGRVLMEALLKLSSWALSELPYTGKHESTYIWPSRWWSTYNTFLFSTFLSLC